MIGKIRKGKDFIGLVKYTLGKEDASLLFSEGVFLGSNRDISDSFDMQAGMNPGLKTKVGHISLSFSPRDKEKFTDELMIEIAREYLQRMGITDTQFIIVRHRDREHPHCHIVYNRVSNSGRTLPDSGDFLKNFKICKELTRKYGLYMPKGKENVKICRLREPLRSKYEMREIIKDGVEHCSSWQELKDYLVSRNIEVSFKYKGNTREIQGVSFKRGEYSFKGSEIDRQLSYARITRHLEKNTKGESRGQQVRICKKTSNSSNSSTILGNILKELGHTHVPNNKVKPKFPDEDEENEEDEENTSEELRQRKRKMKP